MSQAKLLGLVNGAITADKSANKDKDEKKRKRPSTASSTKPPSTSKDDDKSRRKSADGEISGAPKKEQKEKKEKKDRKRKNDAEWAGAASGVSVLVLTHCHGKKQPIPQENVFSWHCTGIV